MDINLPSLLIRSVAMRQLITTMEAKKRAQGNQQTVTSGVLPNGSFVKWLQGNSQDTSTIT